MDYDALRRTCSGFWPLALRKSFGPLDSGSIPTLSYVVLPGGSSDGGGRALAQEHKEGSLPFLALVQDAVLEKKGVVLEHKKAACFSLQCLTRWRTGTDLEHKESSLPFLAVPHTGGDGRALVQSARKPAFP